MNLAGFDLNLLLVFDALVRERHVTRAGERIGLSQPAVSAALNRLRHIFKDELFVRGRGGMAPTPRALALAEPVRQALARVEAALASSGSFDPGSTQRRFTLMCADYFGFVLMPRLVRDACEGAPGIELRVIDSARGDIAGLLGDGEIDVAIDIARDHPDAIRSTFLMRERYVCAASAGHPDIQDAGIEAMAVLPLELFCRLPHALRSVSGDAHGVVDAALAALGRRRTAMLTLPHFSAVAQAVAESRLIAALPERLAAMLAPRLGLALYELPVELSPLNLVLYWHGRLDDDAGHAWLRSRIAAVAHTLPG